MLRGVADANVLVSALVSPLGICGRLLTATDDGGWMMVVSPRLLTELEDVLHRERFRRWVTVEEVVHFFARLHAVAQVVPDAPQPWPPVTRDTKDDYLVALVQTIKVDALVSGDDDLLSLTDRVPPVIRPADFLAMVNEGR